MVTNRAIVAAAGKKLFCRYRARAVAVYREQFANNRTKWKLLRASGPRRCSCCSAVPYRLHPFSYGTAKSFRITRWNPPTPRVPLMELCSLFRRTNKRGRTFARSIYERIGATRRDETNGEPMCCRESTYAERRWNCNLDTRPDRRAAVPLVFYDIIKSAAGGGIARPSRASLVASREIERGAVFKYTGSHAERARHTGPRYIDRQTRVQFWLRDPPRARECNRSSHHRRRKSAPVLTRLNKRYC